MMNYTNLWGDVSLHGLRRIGPERASAQVTPRPFDEVARFFDGLELTDPGVVDVTRWRPDLLPGRPAGTAARQSLVYGGVARKPPATRVP